MTELYRFIGRKWEGSAPTDAHTDTHAHTHTCSRNVDLEPQYRMCT